MGGKGMALGVRNEHRGRTTRAGANGVGIGRPCLPTLDNSPSLDVPSIRMVNLHELVPEGSCPGIHSLGVHVVSIEKTVARLQVTDHSEVVGSRKATMSAGGVDNEEDLVFIDWTDDEFDDSGSEAGSKVTVQSKQESCAESDSIISDAPEEVSDEDDCRPDEPVGPVVPLDRLPPGNNVSKGPWARRRQEGYTPKVVHSGLLG